MYASMEAKMLTLISGLRAFREEAGLCQNSLSSKSPKKWTFENGSAPFFTFTT